jgi:uncharacterized protein HemY
MPLSIRLKPALEQRVAEYAVRNGKSKSAVIAKSVEEYLERNSGPELYALYQRVAPALPARPAKARGPRRTVRERYAEYARAKHARRARR